VYRRKNGYADYSYSYEYGDMLYQIFPQDRGQFR